MFRRLSTIAAIGLLPALLALPLHAADPNPAEARLREGLKNTMLQLREAQTQLGTAQAAQAESEQKNEALSAELEKLKKQTAEDKDASDKTIAELRIKLDERDVQIAQLRESLEKWKASQKKAADLAAKTEEQRARLAAEVIVLNRRVADQQTKNAAMFKLGNEILTRYEKFGLGDALTAREPFVGITRVKFENLIQDYQDKVADQQIKPIEQKAPNKAPAPPINKPKKSEASTEKAPGQRS